LAIRAASIGHAAAAWQRQVAWRGEKGILLQVWRANADQIEMVAPAGTSALRFASAFPEKGQAREPLHRLPSATSI
jgi:hypothetical protein